MKTKKTAKIAEKITKEMKIEVLAEKFPIALPLLMKEGLHCFGCGAANFETVEEGLLVHGKTKKEIDAIIKKLNSVVSKKKA